MVYPAECSRCRGAFAIMDSYGIQARFININRGENILARITSLLQQGTRAISILAAVGSVSIVSFKRETPGVSPMTHTFQGFSPILALSGFYTLNVASDVPIGCLYVSVFGPDGYTLAGAVAGVLIAATRVRVIIRILVALQICVSIVQDIWPIRWDTIQELRQPDLQICVSIVQVIWPIRWDTIQELRQPDLILTLSDWIPKITRSR
ncbi:unnamed protein product [Fraxinus pennsylvanica]|uniref:AT-hook motif nuclear-localized protein n=1 Tax=Fraxinus pennsylvanica TaxID=56036 RepID=A0AAD2A4Y9_9LAMI|nr:unnamed protein product [Fraxinus pennsylvanica]